MRKGSSAPLKDPETDHDIPARVYGAWKPEGGARMLHRPLNRGERARLQGRRDELIAALEPFAPEDRENVETAYLAMLTACNVRVPADELSAKKAVLFETVQPYPAWGIVQGLRRISAGEAGVNLQYEPKTPEINHVVRAAVAPYRERLRAVEALLAAEVDAEPHCPPRVKSSNALMPLPDRPRPAPPVPPATEAA